jgi:lipopolysaccharide heptosyltransferase II
MPRETILTTAAAQIVRIPFRLWGKRPFIPPQKVLILKPCCISQVMLTTPLLAALHKAYPQARFDWAVSDWARPAIAGNPHLTELIGTGAGGLEDLSWSDIRQFIARLRQEEYDTCFIPSRSSLLALIAWRAGIPQRIGLDVNGRGFAHTLPVKPSPDEQHEAAIYLSLARAIGIDQAIVDTVGMAYYAPDLERTAVTRRLIDELNWLGDTPLIVIHPGGGVNPVHSNKEKQWPVERFVRLGNHLAKKYKAQILIVGGEGERPLAQKICGLMHATAANWAGSITLGELGALGEIASLYIGNDAGPTHIAAAVGCPTLVVYGPSNPAVSGPYAVKDPAVTLWHQYKGRFAWSDGVTVQEAVTAAESLIIDHQNPILN